MKYFESIHASGEGVQLVSTMYGDKVVDTGPPNSTEPNVQLATSSVFRNYNEPPPKVIVIESKPMCEYEGCRAYGSVAGQGYCIGHARKLGLVENWGKNGRVHEPE